jgi:hypothetical protein
MGGTASNPISGDKKEQIKRITERVVGTFTEEYLIAFKDVMIKEAKKTRKIERKKLEREEKRSKSTTEKIDPRPRDKKNRRKVDPKLQAKIKWWEHLDTDVDPYVAYIVESSLGGKTVSVYRRFNKFKELEKKYSKKVKVTFPSAKPFEGRKFEYDYLSERSKKLAEFLEAIVSNEELAKEEYLIKWLGLEEPEDPVMKEVFDMAFYRCQRRLWIWKRIPYDEEGEAISKLVIEEIKREMWYDIRNGLPNQEKIRKIAMQAVYKTVSAIVGPLVSAGWEAAQQAVKPVTDIAKEILGNAFDKLLEVEENIKNQLTEGIKRGIGPVMEALKPILGGLSEVLSEPFISVFQESVEEIGKIRTTFVEGIKNANDNKFDEIKSLVTHVKEEKYRKINLFLQDKLNAVIGDLGAKVTIEDLGELFSPLKNLIEIIESGFNLILNPEKQLYCLQALCEQRHIIESLDISKNNALNELEELLDREESEVLWRRWWTWYYYNCEAWSLYYNVWRLPGIGSSIYPIRKAALDYARLHYDYDKKFSFKFGDHLHHLAKTATPENWKATVEEAFMIGFNKANKMFFKRAKKIMETLVIKFFYESIAGKIEKMIIGGMKEIINPLERAIPDPINKILDLNTVVSESVQKALKDSVKDLVLEGIISPFVSRISD